MDGLTECWQLEGDAYELKLTERRQEILDTLGDLGPMRVTELARMIDQDKGNTCRRLQDLLGAAPKLRNRGFTPLSGSKGQC